MWVGVPEREGRPVIGPEENRKAKDKKQRDQ